MKTPPKPDPQLLELLPYQAAFATDPSRFKIGLWARQTGKDFTCAAEAVFDCVQNPRTNWLIVAAGERQAIESLEKTKEWAEHLGSSIENYSVSSATGLHRNATAEIKWANGSRIIALPAKPETIRGYSANVILTEFAFHENPEAIWRAIYPSISNPLRGGPKKLRIISTPNGLNNKFAKLWFSNPPDLNPNLCPPGHRAEPLTNSPSDPHPSALYHKSRITIHDAIAAGLPLNAAELQSGLNDSDAWAQEYLCEFADTSSVLFPYDLIGPCESPEATESGVNLSELPAARRGQLFAGIDFGRKQHLTVCWILERIPAAHLALYRPANPYPNPPSAQVPGHSPYFLTREVLTMKNTPTPEQMEMLAPRLRQCARVCLDATGAGVGLGDYLVQRFGEFVRSGSDRPAKSGKIELCPFSPGLKNELFPRLRTAFEQRALRIPVSREIREDLHALQQTVSQNGHISYRAPCSSDGHSDRATALALAWRAATIAPASFEASVVDVSRLRNRSGALRFGRRRALY